MQARVVVRYTFCCPQLSNERSRRIEGLRNADGRDC